MSNHLVHLKDFDYDLPPELVAQEPLPNRSDSRLLSLRKGKIQHQFFSDIVDYLQSGDVLVINDTKVMKARLKGTKDSGGSAEILVERILSEYDAKCQVRVSKALQVGRYLRVHEHEVLVTEKQDEFYVLRFPAPVANVLDKHGEVPLPPYIRREPSGLDVDRYQTVYAEQIGAVAAPTAGLHFSAELLALLRERDIRIVPVTLHIGVGTFQPVWHERLDAHRMHTEFYTIPTHSIETIEACRGRVVAVGTTVVRTLESWQQFGKTTGETDLFIRPGYMFQIVDALITNFHLPKSTLLMLVSAFAGYDDVRAAYREAVLQEYRFFSYGDAMYCERASM